MTRDPLAGLSTTARLWMAAVLGLAPMGLAWSYQAGYLLTYPGYCYSYDEYGNCIGYSTNSYLAPGTTSTVAHSRVGALLALAAALLALVAALRRTDATRTVARAATVLLAVAVLLALAHGGGQVAVLAALALGFAAPPAWRRPVRVS